MTARLFIRINFESGAVLGPGMVELLERIEKHGSLRRGAMSMGMSYRKAWLLIDGMAKTFGGPVITVKIGGTGNGAKLSELGHALVEIFHNAQKSVEQATAMDLHAISALVRNSARSRQKRKGIGGFRPYARAEKP